MVGGGAVAAAGVSVFFFSSTFGFGVLDRGVLAAFGVGAFTPAPLNNILLIISNIMLLPCLGILIPIQCLASCLKRPLSPFWTESRSSDRKLRRGSEGKTRMVVPDLGDSIDWVKREGLADVRAEVNVEKEVEADGRLPRTR